MWKYPFFEKIVYAHQVTPFKAMSDMRLTYCHQSGNVVNFFNDDTSWISYMHIRPPFSAMTAILTPLGSIPTPLAP